MDRPILTGRTDRACNATLVRAGRLALAVILLGGATAFTAPAQAQTVGGGGFSEIFDCSTVASETERLACYDAAVGRLRAAQSSGEVAVVRREDVVEVERDGFGFNLPALPRLKGIFGGGKDKSDRATNAAREANIREDDTPSRITGKRALTAPVISSTPAASPIPRIAPVEAVRVAEAEAVARRSTQPSLRPTPEDIDKIVYGLKGTKTIGYKNQRFFLENGQVWDQTDNNSLRIPKTKDGQTNTVEIRRAALGSYLLRVNGSGAAVRVRRRR